MAPVKRDVKKIEYCEIKPYWEERLARYSTPFLLRLIDGMSADTPKATVEVRRVKRDERHGVFELHLGQILEVRNWK